MLGRSSFGMSLGLPRGRAGTSAPPIENLGAGIGDTQLQGGQLYQSTIPGNTFPPESFGWELYGDEL